MIKPWMLIWGALVIGLSIAGCPTTSGTTDDTTDNGSQTDDSGGTTDDGSDTSGGTGDNTDGGDTSGGDQDSGDNTGDTGDTSDNTDGGDTSGGDTGDGGTGDGDTGDGDTGGTDGDDGSGDDGGDTAPSLTTAQTDAITLASQTLRHTFAALSALRSLTNPRLDMEGILVPGLWSAPFEGSTCPTSVQFVANSEQIAGSLVFGDLGNGCSDTVTGSQTFSGVIDFDLDRNALTGVFDFTTAQAGSVDVASFTLDNIPTTGSYSPAIATTDEGRDLNGELILSFEGLTHVNSDNLTVALTSTGMLTIGSTTLILNDGTDIPMLLANIVVDPSNSSSFLPISGTATFTVSGEAYVVTFDADTPSSREVRVQVAGGAQQTFTLPEF